MLKLIYLVILVCSFCTSLVEGQTVNNYYNTPTTVTNQPTFSNTPTVIPTQSATTFPSFQTPSFNTPQPIFGVEAINPVTSANSAYPVSTSTPIPGYSFPQTTTATGVTSQGVTQGSLLQQVYPEPAKPNPVATQPLTQRSVQLNIPSLPLEVVAPPDTLTPGLATIKNGKWMISDFFYNLPINIGVKVEVFKPSEKYVPVVERQIEARVRDLFQVVNIIPDPLLIPCQPPLPIYHVVVMAYPCDKRCVGFITAQLYENAKPTRITEDINGIWQVVTWERQEMVVSACENFSDNIMETITDMTTEFTERYKYYHPIEQIPCFTTK